MESDEDPTNNEAFHSPSQDADSPASSQSKKPYPSCDFCRKLKIKCERPRNAEQCNQCIARDAICTSTIKPKKPRVKRQDHLFAIENRIRQMESVIARKLEDPSIESAAQGDISKQVGISDNLSMVVINEKGASQFVGASSGFSLFSPRGLQWISKKTGNQNLENLVIEVKKLDPATWDLGSWSRYLNVAWHPLPEAQREPLPIRDVALTYVEAYFMNFNTVFPLFKRTMFEEKFERQYSDQPPTEVSWYACFNMVLALGSAIVSTSYPNRVHAQDFGMVESEICSSKYLANATSVFIDLQFGHPDLMAIQAVLAMTYMLQGTPNPLAPYTLVSTAARLGHSVGLHRWLDDYGLTKEQADERRNVFWILFVIDKNMSLQSGRPSIIQDQDIGVALPKEKPDEYFPGGKRIFDTFVVSAKLALIESRVYSELYSARARTRTVLQRLVAIGKLDNELQKLLEIIPIEIRPAHEIICDERQLLPVIMLHHAYHNCVTAIHRVSIYHGPWTSDPGDQNLPHHGVKLNPRVYESESICVKSARHTIETLQYFERDRALPMVWLAVTQPMCAALTLFANILQHPNDPDALSDLDRITSVTSTLGLLVETGRIHMGTTALWIFQELHKIGQLFLLKEAQMTVEKDEEQTTTPNKVRDMVQSIENFSLPSDFRYPNQYSQDGTFNDDMLMLMGPNSAYEIGDLYNTPEGGWYNPMDIQ